MSGPDSERTTNLYVIIIAALSLIYYVVTLSMVWNFSTLTASDTLPLAPDFANYWSASKLALSGNPALVYNTQELHRIQQKYLGKHHRKECGWYYPPTFLLIVLPLGLLPYLAAFFMWMGFTLALYMIVLSRLGSPSILLSLLVLLLFPGIYENFAFGQNAFLSGTLLGGGLLLLGGLPVAAGCLIGLLTYKPPLVILILITLIWGRYWQAFAAAVITSLAMILISVMVFGYQIWIDYFKVMSVPLKLLESGSAAWYFMPTFFAAMRSVGFGVNVAYLVQGTVMLLVLAGVAWVWNRREKAPLAMRGSVLVLGTLLFTPYVFVYDLALLALPLAWLWEDGRLRGRLPGELLLFLMGWLVPTFASALWLMTKCLPGRLQIGPVVLLALFLLSLVKARQTMAGASINP